MSAALSVFGIALLIVHLMTAGFPEPKAILGGVCMIVFYGWLATRDFAFEKKKHSPTYIRERERVINLAAIGSDISRVVDGLGSVYARVGDAAGLSLSSGTCRVIDLSGPVAHVRIEAIDSKISRVTVLPKQVVGLKEALSILRESPPPSPPSRPQARDWMGNPLDKN